MDKSSVLAEVVELADVPTKEGFGGR